MVFVLESVCVCVGVRVRVYVCVCVWSIAPKFMHAVARACVCVEAICFRVYNGANDYDDDNSTTTKALKT